MLIILSSFHIQDAEVLKSNASSLWVLQAHTRALLLRVRARPWAAYMASQEEEPCQIPWTKNEDLRVQFGKIGHNSWNKSSVVSCIAERMGVD